ncbi:diaminopimelate epimerase [Sulfurospirillum arcachonense]|uniref:diaminopimelate epimerase n=1 Tax=Sulfurospirillum arcachonense TaxID=57666 RepID=UPI000468DDB6|nr:diaminopimelate epimerase [Sulfurospirillum arcachonense]
MQVSKYNASGNDFVIFHTFQEQDFAHLAKQLCHRQQGVGADGLIVLVPNAGCDFKWLFYNNDGSHAAMCGNGTRACAHYAYTNGLANKNMKFLTDAGMIHSIVEGNMVESELTEVKKISEKFEEDGKEWFFYDTGVPHLVTVVKNLDEYSKELASKMRYKYNANVNFVLFDGKSLHVRTYERGVEDETGACGTGMAACFYALNYENIIKDSIKVYPSSKEELSLRIDNGKLFFKGEVKKVFETII